MDLVPYMFWESQEQGSLLCAQHCLNNLLQQHTYTEFDLAEIAQRLDQAENAALSAANQIKKSYNYDDSGYFSISVLERAMEVWDLTLVRWRGEAMRRYQEKPEEQAAFILNLANHWIPLRRFSPHPQPTASTKRWYNLNSFLPNGPEWISPTYLRMVLSQAEEEGYSVFCVRKATQGRRGEEESIEGVGWEDGGVGVLPESEADRLAVVLGEPVSRTGAGGPDSATTNVAGGSGTGVNPDQPTVDPHNLPESSPGPSDPFTEQDRNNVRAQTTSASRRRRRQEDLAAPPTTSDPYAQFQPPRPARNPPRAHSSPPPADVLDGQTGAFQYDDDDEQLDAEHDAPREDYDRIGSYRREEQEYGGPTDFQYTSRSYDDEDAALQAALKASMDDLPEGWVAPAWEEKKAQKQEAPAQAAPAPTAAPVLDPPVEDTGAGPSFKEEIEDDDDDAPTEQLSADEIRRRRLARFGE